MDNKDMPITDKYSLSIKEEAQYFSIGIKKMRRLAEDKLGILPFTAEIAT